VARIFTWLKVVLATIVVAECAWLIYDEHRPAGVTVPSVSEALSAAAPLPKPRVDRHVQQASTLLSPVAMSGAALFGMQTATSGEVQLEGVSIPGDAAHGDKIEWPRNYLQDKAQILLPSVPESVTLKFSHQITKTPVHIRVNGVVDEATSKVDRLQVILEDLDFSTSRSLQIEIFADEDFTLAKRLRTIVLRAPVVGGDAIGAPVVERYINNANSNTTKKLQGATLRVYGNFLQLSGIIQSSGFQASGSQLEWLLVNKRGEVTADQPQVDRKALNRDSWKQKLKFPLLAGGDYYLYPVHRKFSSAHQSAGQPTPFTFVTTDPDALPIPAIASLAAGQATADPDLTEVKKINEGTLTFQIDAGFSDGDVTAQDALAVVYRSDLNGQTAKVGQAPLKSSPSTFEVKIDGQQSGEHHYYAQTVVGNLESRPSRAVHVQIQTKGPQVTDFSPQNRTFGPGRMIATVYFDPKNPPTKISAETEGNYNVFGPDAKNGSEAPLTAVFNANDSSVRLTFRDMNATGNYTINVLGNDSTSPLQDEFNNSLAAAKSYPVLRTATVGVPAVQKGVTTTGPYVPFQEYTKPRQVPDGFNPSDKVETRVARLYYYRDAHRVAQIVNRKARSYNRQAVDMAQQQADHARSEADDSTSVRRRAEQQAIEAAKQARQAEKRLADLQQQLTQYARDAQAHEDRAERLNREIAREEALRERGQEPDEVKLDELRRQSEKAQQQAQSSRMTVDSVGAQVANAQMAVQKNRDNEVQTNETLLGANEKEEKLRAEQFRREVAAAHADPDTYAPGEPASSDPVEQVSVSVVGEGLIQLRGPIKGINIIRKMINELDAPVGQVRVQIHTLQVNGEHAGRMERSIGDIQRSVDQSRFLTLQTAEMLRKSVAQVAARRAMEVRANFPGVQKQSDRDMLYLHAFFGQDFIEELRAIDSEFLHTGNKVLSLHSMDSTSLANALFIMALAKNETRREILATFDEMLRCELPRAEQSYLESTFACIQRDCKDWMRDCGCCNKEGYCPLACNARFETLRGFFNAEIVGDNTITPIQREFIRLSQIFKARLVTELEYKQRVVERAVIEERFGGSYAEQLKKARLQELQADQELTEQRRVHNEQVLHVRAGFQELLAEVHNSLQEIEESQRSLKPFRKIIQEIRKNRSLGISRGTITLDRKKINYQVDEATNEIVFENLSGDANEMILNAYQDAYGQMEAIFKNNFSKYKYRKWKSAYHHAQDSLRAVKQENTKRKNQSGSMNQGSIDAILQLFEDIETLSQGIQEEAYSLEQSIDEVLLGLSSAQADTNEVYRKWVRLRNFLQDKLWEDNTDRQKRLIDQTHTAFKTILESSLKVQQAQEQAQLARRPLDHKKFLDMLVDDLEDKYIELLEGTRAHTANVDNYIKRIATALEDDFNTQFYFPTFRMVRRAGRYRDVTFGQIETTSVLANNRELGKVSPQATMEFDLPKRDILVTEALKGAKAAVDEYGALLSDPTFLSLAKMGSGMPTASPQGGASAGFSSVRNVLPGLESSTQEQILNQSGPGDTQIGSAFESLIPDPAVYKFETGTGYEIRPVVQPDGQAVVFDFNYMYTTNVREPVRADEKHLGRIKRHYIDTDVQLSNYELREISRYQVQLKASRTARGVPLLEDVPLVGVLFRPLPQQESSLQQNLILGQTVIYPTLFDLMGLRWAPAVADLDPLRLSNEEFLVRGRHRMLQNRVYDHASSRVDDFLRIPESMRRQDLYRTQESIPARHPNGYNGSGLDRSSSTMQEGYQPERTVPQPQYYPSSSPDGNPYRLPAPQLPMGSRTEPYLLDGQHKHYEELMLPQEEIRLPQQPESLR